MSAADPAPVVTYRPGEWVAVVSGPACLLADVDPASPVVARCWELIKAGAAATDLLLHEDFRTVGSFAFARLGVGGAAGQVVVRGQVCVELVAGSGAVEMVRASGVTTWVERAIDDSVAVLRISRSGGAAASELPLSGGVVLADWLGLRTRAGAMPPPEPTPVSAVPPSPRQEELPEPSPSLDPLVDAVVEPASTSTESDESDESDEVALEHPVTPDPTDRARPQPDPAPVPPPPQRIPVPVVTPPSTPGPQQDDVIDSLDWAIDVTALMPSRSPAPQAAATPVSANPVPAPSADSLADGNGTTVLRRPRQQGGVFAARCPAGHLNPEGLPACRNCGAPVPNQETLVVVRPELGVLRLSNGQVIALNRNVLLGRAPVLPEGEDERDWNRIMLNNRHISATHLAVRLQGWEVTVTDLGSSNRTEVRVSEMSSWPLQPWEPMPIEPGTEVTMADEISFRYEVTG